MAVIIQCPHCQQKLEIDQDPSGMELECPVCNKKFSVQKDPVTPDSAAPAPAASVQPDNSGTFTFVCPSCSTVTELPVSLMGQKYECRMCFEEHIARATTEKQCPYCGKTIKYHAMVCKYCKANLTKTPPPSKSKTEETFVFICPECDTTVFLPAFMKGQQYECKMCFETSLAQPARERKCPHCGEKIKINAELCWHCKQKVKPLIDPKQRRSRNIGRIAFGLWGIAAVLSVLYSCCRLSSSWEYWLQICSFPFMLTGLSLELLSPKRKNLIAGGIVFFIGVAMSMTRDLVFIMATYPGYYIWCGLESISLTYLLVIVFLLAWYRQKGNGLPGNMIPANTLSGQQTASPAAARLDWAGRIAFFMWLIGVLAYPFFRILFLQGVFGRILQVGEVINLIIRTLLVILISGSIIILELLSTQRKYRIAGLIGFSLVTVNFVYATLDSILSLCRHFSKDDVLGTLKGVSFYCFLLAAFLLALKRNYDITRN